MIIAQKQREGIMSDSIDRQAAIDLVEDIETRRLKGEDGQDLLTDFCPHCGADMREEGK